MLFVFKPFESLIVYPCVCVSDSRETKRKKRIKRIYGGVCLFCLIMFSTSNRAREERNRCLHDTDYGYDGNSTLDWHVTSGKLRVRFIK